jgi:hypothetical protein
MTQSTLITAAVGRFLALVLTYLFGSLVAHIGFTG